ncbi:MAG: hypothetical protein LBF66_00965 [Holosporales bacterium]|nr:hypothetical protein [Holosporales bacterium]
MHNHARGMTMHIPSDAPGFFRPQLPVKADFVPRRVSREPSRIALTS